MLPEELRSSLAEKYDLVCFENLNDIVISHTKIFKIFKQFRRDVYENQQRLVFYSNGRPSLGFLKHLQRAAAQIDVSNFFILICCDHDISQDLKTANDTYGHDDVIINNFQVHIECPKLGEEQFYPHETMCMYPWAHIETDNSGKCYACCKWTVGDHVGDLSTLSFEQAFNSPRMRQLRSELSSGQRPTVCKDCWVTEDAGGKSLRQQSLSLWGKQFDLSWADDAPTLRSISLKPGNTCNFKCRICGPYASSLYASELINHTNSDESKRIKIISRENNDWFDIHRESIFNQITNTKELINLDLYGGEPFLVKSIKKLLEDLISHGLSQQIRLHFNSNGSIYPKDLIPLLKRFKEIEILLSIDNIGKRFEIERGGSWESVYQNILKFKSHQSEQFKVAIYTTVNVQNILYLDELFELFDSIGIEVGVNYINGHTKHFDIDYLTPTAKKLVIDKYQNHKRLLLRTLASRVQQSTGSNGKKFIEVTDQFDRWRDQKFSESHSEIYQAMKTHG